MSPTSLIYNLNLCLVALEHPDFSCNNYQLIGGGIIDCQGYCCQGQQLRSTSGLEVALGKGIDHRSQSPRCLENGIGNSLCF